MPNLPIFTIVCPTCGRVHYTHDSYCSRVAECSCCIDRAHLAFMGKNLAYSCHAGCICGNG